MGAKFSTSSKKRQARQSSSQRQNQFQTNSGSSDGSVMRFGRKFHDVSSSAYWFPNDDEEIDRLVGQHFALKTLFRGNVVEKCRESVPLEQGALVLDVGCGPGTWLMDMATEYPCSNFIGVDMCDIFPTNIRPSNVSFQVANVLERLPFPDNTFDFVNMRLFIIALRKEQWPTVIKELYRVLKPGGYLQSVECGMLERGNDFIVWAGQVFKDTIFSRGQEPHVASQLPTLQQNAGFIIEHYETKDIYLGRSDHVNREFLWDACTIFKTAQPFLAEPLGIAPQNYPLFLKRLCQECQKLPEAMWSFSVCMGQKPRTL